MKEHTKAQDAKLDEHIKCKCCRHIGTSQLICPSNQLTGFYMSIYWHLMG